MKKLLITSVLILILVAIFALSGCGSEPDVWDGSVAAGFAGGDGTEGKPYKIETGAELAYLAKSVNEGNSYTGKYFVLENDIDLNNVEWTPIGITCHPDLELAYQDDMLFFSGNFDGNDHTISNLKITRSSFFTKSSESYDYITNYEIAGLFGACIDASIANIRIYNASIAIPHNDETHLFSYVGILSGFFSTMSKSELSNIIINDSEIRFSGKALGENETGYNRKCLYTGGIIGYFSSLDTAETNAERLESNVTIDISSSPRNESIIGGIVGYIYTSGDFGCNNFASYINVLIPTEFKQTQTNCTRVGAFGSIFNKGTDILLSDGFSNIKTSVDPTSYLGRLLIGVACASPDLDKDASGGIKFENIYGGIHHIEGQTEFAPIYEMHGYVNPATGTEYDSDAKLTNCIGCTTLPKDHKLSKKVWELSDLSNPRLK